MTSSILQKYIKQYATKGILVDTNLLLLFFIGIFDENYIKTFKRTKGYSIEEFSWVEDIIHKFSKIIVTPQILAELSNLSKQMDKPKLKQYFSKLVGVIKKSREIYINKDQLMEINSLVEVGFTDFSIIKSATAGKYLVFTDDWPLIGYLQKEKVDVINLNWFRTERWKI